MFVLCFCIVELRFYSGALFANRCTTGRSLYNRKKFWICCCTKGFLGPHVWLCSPDIRRRRVPVTTQQLKCVVGCCGLQRINKTKQECPSVSRTGKIKSEENDITPNSETNNAHKTNRRGRTNECPPEFFAHNSWCLLTTFFCFIKQHHHH